MKIFDGPSITTKHMAVKYIKKHFAWNRVRLEPDAWEIITWLTFSDNPGVEYPIDTELTRVLFSTEAEATGVLMLKRLER